MPNDVGGLMVTSGYDTGPEQEGFSTSIVKPGGMGSLDVLILTVMKSIFRLWRSLTGYYPLLCLRNGRRRHHTPPYVLNFSAHLVELSPPKVDLGDGYCIRSIMFICTQFCKVPKRLIIEYRDIVEPDAELLVTEATAEPLYEWQPGQAPQPKWMQ